jgi:hypothetical protein
VLADEEVPVVELRRVDLDEDFAWAGGWAGECIELERVVDLPWFARGLGHGDSLKYGSR